MIELIQSIFSEGDFIKIFFNNSSKSVEGYILKILPSSIAIKTKEGKIHGIKAQDIDSFEEGVIANTECVEQPNTSVEEEMETTAASVTSDLNADDADFVEIQVATAANDIVEVADVEVNEEAKEVTVQNVTNEKTTG